MLLELNWPAGRLVREYTFLLDPPEVAAKGAAPVTSATAARAAADARKPPAAVRSASANDDVRRQGPAAAKAAPQNAPEKIAEQAPAAKGDSVEVKRGDTLRKIANETNLKAFHSSKCWLVCCGPIRTPLTAPT